MKKHTSSLFIFILLGASFNVNAQTNHTFNHYTFNKVKDLPVQYLSLGEAEKEIKNLDTLNIVDHTKLQKGTLPSVYQITQDSIKKETIRYFVSWSASSEIPDCDQKDSKAAFTRSKIYQKMCAKDPSKQATVFDIIRLSASITQKLIPTLQIIAKTNPDQFKNIRHSMYAQLMVEIYQELIDRYHQIQNLPYTTNKLFPHVAVTSHSRSQSPIDKEGNPTYNRVTFAFHSKTKIILTELDPALFYFTSQSENANRLVAKQKGILSLQHPDYFRFLDKNNTKLWYLLDIGYLDDSFLNSRCENLEQCTSYLAYVKSEITFFRALKEVFNSISKKTNKPFHEIIETIDDLPYDEDEDEGVSILELFKNMGIVPEKYIFIKNAIIMIYEDEGLENLTKELIQELKTEGSIKDSELMKLGVLTSQVISEYILLMHEFNYLY